MTKNIIKFDEYFEITKIKKQMSVTRKKNKKFCQCMRIRIVEQDREIICRDCDKKLSPFDYLINWAWQEEKYEMRARSLYNQCEELEKKLIELKRQERNTKQRLKNYAKKNGTG